MPEFSVVDTEAVSGDVGLVRRITSLVLVIILALVFVISYGEGNRKANDRRPRSAHAGV